MDSFQELVDDSIVGHSVENSGKWEHGTQQACAESEDSSYGHNPLDLNPSNLIKHIRERSIWVLETRKKILGQYKQLLKRENGLAYLVIVGPHHC